MSLRRPAKEQPENFEFNNSSLEAAILLSQISKSNTKCCMALLYIAQNKI